jgi:WD40 repeat protein
MSLIRLLQSQALLPEPALSASSSSPLIASGGDVSAAGTNTTKRSPLPASTLAALLPTEEERLAEAQVDVPPLEEDETVWCLAWSGCGGYLASGGDEGGVRIWKRG